MARGRRRRQSVGRGSARGRSRKAFPLEKLPEELQVKIVEMASRSSSSAMPHTVCKKWSEEGGVDLVSLHIVAPADPDMNVTQMELVRTIEKNPLIQSLRLGPYCTKDVGDDFLEHFGLIPDLRELGIEEQGEGSPCFTERGLVELFDTATNLTSLELADNSHEIEIPDNISSLENLTSLSLGPETRYSGKPSFSDYLPPTIGELSGLRKLVLNCSALAELPESFTDLVSLETLHIEAENMPLLPRNIGACSSLTSLYVWSTAMRTLPDSIYSLARLSRLSLHLRSLRALPQNFGNLSSLTDLVLKCGLRPVDKTHCLPTSLGAFSNLESLTIDCPRLPLGSLDLGQVRNSLRKLELNCSSSPLLPSSLCSLHMLEELKLGHCQKGSLGRNNFSSLTSLRKLMIVSNEDGGLYRRIGRLPSLEELHLTSCGGLKKLPGYIGSLVSLKCLSLLSCQDLLALHPSLSKLTNLESLDIQLCCRLRSLPDNLDRCGIFTVWF